MFISRGLVVICVFLLAARIVNSETAGWSIDRESADGPTQWSSIEPKCGGASQSPIDIRSDSAVEFLTDEPLVFHLGPNDNFMFINNGFNVVIETLDRIWTLSGGALNGTYYCEEIEFHWGEKCGEGSQHQVDGKSFPMEINLVYFNEYFQNVEDALASGQKDAVAIVAVFVEIQSSDPLSAPDKVAINLNATQYKGDAANIVDNIRISLDSSGYFQYRGSLTAPPCDEVVAWTVLSQPLYIAEDKLNLFRQLKSTAAGETPEKLAAHTFRPVQDLNGRKVLKTRGLKPVQPQPCSR